MFTFEINGAKWEIREVANSELNDKEGYYTHGLTAYKEDIIYINETSPEKIRTLKHELTHCWLYMYGHNQDEKEFNNEDVCEIVASINDFINEVVNKYEKSAKQKHQKIVHTPMGTIIAEEE